MVFLVGSYWHQWQAGLSLSLVLLVVGFANGWISPYIAQLTAPDSTHALKLTPSEASWMASLLYLGRLFGNVVGATIQEFIGRKKTLLYSGAPFAFGWLVVLITTSSVPLLYTSRLFCGISTGIIYSAFSSFLGEIVDPKIRGTLIIWNINMTLVGHFLGNTMGTYLSMEIFSYISLAVTGLFIALFAFVPESPYHYIVIGNTKRAEESLQWYTRNADVRKELRELQEFIGSTSMSLVNRLNEFTKPEHRRNLIIMCCLNLFLFCAGANTLSAYCEIILINSKVSLKPSIVVMALSFAAIVVSFIAMISVDKFGRRPLLIVSGFGVCAAQVGLGFHFQMLSLNVDPASISWLPIFALFLDNCLMCSGLGTVPHALIGELFPPIFKTPATFIFSASGALLSFAVVKIYQPYLNLVGEKYVFWTFAVSALSSVALTYFYVPETKQRTLVDIQRRNLPSENPKNVTT